MSTSLIKVLRRDKKFKKLTKLLESTRKKIDAERDTSEAFALHSGLKVRSLYGRKTFSPKSILLSISQLQANRSRLVELRARATENVSYLNKACTAFKKYAYAEYVQEFKEYRTQNQRDSVVQTALVEFLEFEGEVDTLIDILDVFIKDIDQASHSVRHIIDVLKLLDNSKGGTVIS